MFILCLASAYIKTEDGKNELEKLIKEIGLTGSTDALSKLYELTSPAVYSFALSILRNTHDAEDVLHDLFVTVYSAASSYKKGNPLAWMLTVAKNLCLMKIREQKKNADASDEFLESIPLPETLCTEDRLVLEECLNKLDSDERQIVVLHAVSGIKHKEIAKLLDFPIATVLSKYNRALKKLREMISI